jgi:hypothetical protein
MPHAKTWIKTVPKNAFHAIPYSKIAIIFEPINAT